MKLRSDEFFDVVSIVNMFVAHVESNRGEPTFGKVTNLTIT
jgi:hypothetical protein